MVEFGHAVFKIFWLCNDVRSFWPTVQYPEACKSLIWNPPLNKRIIVTCLKINIMFIVGSFIVVYKSELERQLPAPQHHQLHY